MTSSSTDANPIAAAEVGFTETCMIVTEDVGTKVAFVLFTTNFPLQQDVTFEVRSFDISAMSFSTRLGMSKYYNLHIYMRAQNLLP